MSRACRKSVTARLAAPGPYALGVPELGLFPLGLVLLPSERIPLHIFEPRYKELIAECLAESREFGLSSPTTTPCGTSARALPSWTASRASRTGE